MTKFFQNKTLNTIIKLLIFIGLLVVLYKQIIHNENLQKVVSHFRNTFKDEYSLLMLVFLLMLLNWSIETVKWKYLINKWHELSWLEAIEGILFGITFSMFTPNRVGEFGGRVWALKTDRITAIVSTLIGSYAQIVVNICLGAAGFLCYTFYAGKNDIYLNGVFVFFFLLILVATHLTYFNLDFVSAKFSKIKALQKIRNYIDVINKYNNADLIKLELLSFSRYCIYCLQFMLLLKFFGVQVPVLLGFVLVSAIFFIQTINPFSIDLLDIGFRGNVAVFFLAPYTDNNLGILATTITLWLINLVFPAMIGGIAALQFKFFREE
ncbi:MAG: lysylphosphatidylglycerol synthase domain-containing protein [Chitinophagales bacterium]